MAPQLIILRHGNTFDKGDTIRRVGAPTDLPLSTSGRMQAEAVGKFMASEFGAVEHILSSPLLRAHETAEFVAAAYAPSPTIEITATLTEIDHGPDEGQPEPDVIARIGAHALKAWEHDATPPPDWIVDPTALISGWREIFQNAYERGGQSVAVTSNGVARFALHAADAIDGEFPQKLRTGAFGLVSFGQDGQARVTAWDIRPPR